MRVYVYIYIHTHRVGSSKNISFQNTLFWVLRFAVIPGYKFKKSQNTYVQISYVYNTWKKKT